MEEETKPQLPVEPPEPELPTPSFWERAKINKPKIFAGVLGIFVFAGALFGAYKLGQRQIQPPQPSPTPETAATPTPDPTADWQTYANDFAKFSIKYPTSMSFEEKSLSGQEKQIIFTGPEGTMTINTAVPTSSGWGGGCDLEQKGEVEFLGSLTQACLTEEWLSQLYGQHPDEYSQVQISANFLSPFSENREVILRILSTFRFLPSASSGQGEEGSLTPALQPISIPEDWVEYTATDPDFGIKTTLSLPPGFSFRFTGSEFTIYNESDYSESWDYSTSIFRNGSEVKNHYKGGSRRAWYQKFIKGEFHDENPLIFEEGEIISVAEHQIGSNSYLEVTVKADPPVNFVGDIEKHYLYVQNGILHIIKPVSHKANSASAQIPNYINIILFSLKSSRIK